MTWGKVLLLGLQIVLMLLEKAQADAAVEKADEDALARVSLLILKRTRYAKSLDEAVDHMSDDDVAARVRSILRDK